MINNLNFIGLTMGKTAVRFDFDSPRRLEDTKVKTPLIINYNKIMNSKEIRNEIVDLMTQMIEKVVDKASTTENPILVSHVTLVGIGMIGSSLATLISSKHNNNIVFADEKDTEGLQFYRGDNCIFIKDEIVNGVKTIEIIDEAQKLGHKTLAIISLMNENLPLTKERFQGKSSVHKTKLQAECPMHAILTPQSIYNQLLACKDKETAVHYQKMMGFSIENEPDEEKGGGEMPAQISQG